MEKGTFVLIDFTGRIAATGEIFDLTSAEEAKKAGIYRDGHQYHPQLVVLGKKMVLPVLERQLEGMKVGEEKTFTVPVEEGFGQRKQELIRVISVQKFFKKQINPVPGMVVDIDGLPVKVQAVSGGRVRCDFNHPLAGKELHYWVKVVQVVENTEEKGRVALDYFHLKGKTTFADGTLTVQVDKMEASLKPLLEKALQDWLPEVKAVVLQQPPAPSQKT